MKQYKFNQRRFILYLLLIFFILWMLPSASWAREDVLQTKGKKLSEIQINPNVKIVGLGESTHGNSRLQSMRWDLFEQLIKQGYSHFGLEAFYEDGRLINDYIQGKVDATGIEIAGRMHFFLYNTKEMAELFDHLKEYNKNHKEKVSFFGFDMQSFDGPLEIFVEEMKSYDEEVVELQKLLKTSNQLSPSEKKTVLQKMEQILQQQKQEILKKQGQSFFDEMDYILTILKQNVDAMDSTKMVIKRDYYMAKNIKWYEEHHQGKVFVCGHNGHILSNFSSSKVMGDYLKEFYGKSYYPIGTAIYDNEFYSKKITILNRWKELQKFTLRSTNPLMRDFAATGHEERLYQFDQLQDKDLKIFQREYTFPEIGAGYNQFLSRSYFDKYEPTKAADAMILLSSDKAYEYLGD
ncbi:MAG: erythromycin esterase family protein [Tissierellia bacterium]|nr:erythromycin esterase family protein [Tissierellia bacterium]